MSRRSDPYTIRFSSGKQATRVTAAIFLDWLQRGYLIETGFKSAKIRSGYIAWLGEGGRPQIRSLWPVISVYMRTNSRIFELLAMYATWGPDLSELEKQWEIQWQYGTESRKNEITIGADLGRFKFS